MTSQSRPRIVAVHAAIVLAVLAGCKESNTVTGVPMARTPTPIPTLTPTPGGPPALSNLTGHWEGTMQPKGCNGDFPVTADITQTGNAVQGRLVQNGCIETFGVLDFTGTFQDGLLDGTTTGDFPGTIHGSLSGTTLTIHAFTQSNFDLGPITLHPVGTGN